MTDAAADQAKDGSRAQGRTLVTEPAISIVSLDICPGRLRCDIRLASFAPHMTSPHLMARVMQVYPSIGAHVCVNAVGPHFADVMDCTSIPHLMEHLLVDIQVRDDYAGGLFVGTSEWIDEYAGTARIEVSFVDDLCALRALNEALVFLTEILGVFCGGIPSQTTR